MLNVRAEKLGDVTVLHIRGRIVNGDATETLSEVVRAQTGACALVLDLAEVDLIDARGLGVLVELRQWTRSIGIEFRLMNVNRLVQQVLAITRLDTVLQMSSNVQRATAVTWRSQSGKLQFAPCAEV
jgi:anti-sigma B factor antagonist